jgi:hypothetical protein
MMEKCSFGARNPVWEVSDCTGVMVVSFGTHIIGDTIGKCFQRQLATWLVTVLVSLDPADIQGYWEVAYFTLDTLQQVIVRLEIVEYRCAVFEFPFEIIVNDTFVV